MNNLEYWEKRSLSLMRKIYNSQEKENKALIKLYKNVLKEIKADLEGLYSKLDDNISLSEAYKYDRLHKIEKQLNTKIKELEKAETSIDKEILSKSYKEAYKVVSKDLGIDFTKIPEDSVEKALNYPWSGHMFSEIVWKNNEQLAYNLKTVITKGLIEGKSYINMAKDLNKTMDKGIKSSLNVIRTETAHIVNQATLDRYEDSGVVQKIRIIAAEDERMCDTCGEMHNTEYELGDEPMLPLHTNCRCCYSPIIEI